MKLLIRTLCFLSILLTLTGCSLQVKENIEEGKTIEEQEPLNNTENKKEVEIIEDIEESPEDKDVTLFSFKDQGGDIFTNEDFKGKYLMINYWGTWCGPCVDELPVLDATYKQYEDDLMIIGVNDQTIPTEKSVEEVIAWVNEKEISYPMYFDMDGQIKRAMQVYGYPTTFLFDTEGNFIDSIVGGLDERYMKQLLSTYFSLE